MSTSGSYDRSSTMSNIIYDAFAEINAHDANEALPGDKWAYGKRKLNQLMSFLSIHRGLWLRTSKTHTLTPGTASYAIGSSQTIDTPKPMQIISVKRTLSSIDYPLTECSWDEYHNIPNKTLQSSPLLYHYHPGTTTGTFYVWPTGTATDYAITIYYHRLLQDFDSESNNPDMPEEWVLLLTVMLAELLSPKYNGGVIPQGIMQIKNELLGALLPFDEERTGITITL